MASKDLKVKKKTFKAIQNRYTYILSCYELYRNNPFNKDYIHRLRVEMRKLRALLSFLKPIIDKEVYGKLNNNFRDLGKLLSPLRDLDTLIGIMSEIAKSKPDLINNYANIFSYLEKERYQSAKEGTKKKFIKEFDQLLFETNTVETLELALEETNTATFERFIKERYKDKAKKMKKHYKELDQTNYEAIHEVRKEAKKVRYAAVGFKTILPKKKRKKIKTNAIYIQEHLGQLTDKHVSIDLLSLYRDKAKDEQIKQSFQIIIDYQLNKIDTT